MFEMIHLTVFHIFLVFILGLIHRFSGDKSNANFFKILGSDDTSLLIGARNVVYNISLPSLKENIDQVRYCFLNDGGYWNVVQSINNGKYKSYSIKKSFAFIKLFISHFNID